MDTVPEVSFITCCGGGDWWLPCWAAPAAAAEAEAQRWWHELLWWRRCATLDLDTSLPALLWFYSVLLLSALGRATAPHRRWLHRSKHCMPPPSLRPSWICHGELHVHREVVAVREVPPTGAKCKRAAAFGSVPLLEGDGWAAGTWLGLAAGGRIWCGSTDQSAIHIVRRKRWWWPTAANHQHRRREEEELKWTWGQKDISTPCLVLEKWLFKCLWCERAKVHTFVMVPGQFGCLRFEMANPRKLDVPHQNLPLTCGMSMPQWVCWFICS